jgi:hypothetical protein
MSTPDTTKRGLAHRTGHIYGETTPSVTNIEVIGTLTQDYALNVHIEELDESFWFAAELIELIDHAPGTEIRLHGVPKRWTRSAVGSWLEELVTDRCEGQKPWWKFW